MNEVIFLFGLGFVWMFFAAVQDLKTTEVSNWLTYSLVVFGLAGRAFFAIAESDLSFFLVGVLGFAVYFVIAFGLYYAQAFGGGDVKLLMGVGVLLPYTSFVSVFVTAGVFLGLLFAVGAVYTIVYSSVLIIPRNWSVFLRAFRKYRLLVLVSLPFIIGLFIGLFYYLFLLPFFLLSLIPATFAFTKALEKCMIKTIQPQNLMEGDWLVKDVRVGGRVVKKSVHGLSARDIAFLRKVKKPVVVRQGVPFVPAFLIAWVIMGFVVGVLSVSPPELVRELLSLQV